MSQSSFHRTLIGKSGTSQQERQLAALDPAYARVEDREKKDWLLFAQKLAKELVYTNLQNEADGDWEGFLDVNHDRFLNFLENPDENLFSAREIAEFSKPHRVLFLTFLEILTSHFTPRLNEFSEDHLNYYYREFLQLSHQSSTPDRVHLWFSLSPSQQQVLIPKGSTLIAGKDSLGKELIYETESELIVNKSSLYAAKSLYVETSKTTPKQARESLHRESPNQAFIDMWKVALGEPKPGDSLPNFPNIISNGLNEDDIFSSRIFSFLHFSQDQLRLPFSDLRLLIRLEEEIKPKGKAIQELWAPMNKILFEVGRSRIPNFSFPPNFNPEDFHTNFQLATGINPVPNNPQGTPFETIPLVDNVYDLYKEIKEGGEFENFIKNSLRFQSGKQFRELMKGVNQIREKWLIIYTILETAGRNSQPDLSLLESAPLDYTGEVNDLLQVALPGFERNGPGYSPLVTVRGIQEYNRGLDNLTSYFHLNADELLFIFQQFHEDDVLTQNPALDTQNEVVWNRIYGLTQKAYEAKQITIQENLRGAELSKIALNLLTENPAATAFDEMVKEALGDPNPGNLLPGELTTLLDVEALPSSVRDTYIKDRLFLSQEEFNSLLPIRNGFNSVSIRQAASILALAEGKKRGYAISDEVAIQELTHVYAAPDASAVEKSLGLEEEELIRWRTFGESQRGRSVEERNMEPASLGLAIRSPLLLLTGGRREIKIQLTFHPYSQLAANLTDILALKPFAVKYSSMEEWVELEVDALPVPTLSFSNSEQGSEIILTLQIELSEKMPPLSSSIMEGDNMSHEQPVLQLLLRELSITEDEVETLQSPYQYFQPLSLKSVSLEVIVNDLAPSHLQNKNGVLDPAKSFMPFGIQAKGGANFFIGHPEVSFKKLDGIDVNLHWMGIPDANMGSYYANYTSSPLLNSSFTTKLQLFDNQSIITLSNAYPLFHPTDAFQAQTLHLGEPLTFDEGSGSPNDERVNIEEIIQNVSGQEDYQYEAERRPVTGDKLQDWNRYIILKLDQPGFMHEIYPGRANQLAIQLAADIGREDIQGNATYEINPPYSPELEKISISYKASTQFNFSQQTSGNTQEELLHLSPFGFGPIQKSQDSDAFFMPQFLNEGTLYLAFADVQPPQNLSLLFQVAEGSANPDIPLASLTWSYLSGDDWKKLDEGKIISDTTNGLINSGIVQISLPSDASSAHTLMPSGYHWISIEAGENAQSVCDLVEIHPQGVTALFKDQENASDHLASPLAPDTIAKFKKAIPGIKKIHQPYSSFGGKMPEEDESFYTRVSERLRHKDRATNIWDYEHLVLGSFPQIYKVKCLPADIDSYPDEPGRVDVIVVPDIKGKLPFDPFEPKAPINLLQEIEGYLQEVSSPFAMIKVQNPSYIHLKVRFAVKFLPGKDVGFYLHQLDEDLKRFLAPWAYDDGAEIEFGGKVYTHAIVNFIDEREYVDYMAGMRIFTSTDGENFLPAVVNPADGGIQTQNPSAIWVSARGHEIDTITENTFEAQSFDGVGHMRIELDFQIE